MLARVRKKKDEEARLAAALEKQGYSKSHAHVLLNIRESLSEGMVFLHPVTKEEMHDEMRILNSYIDHQKLVFKDHLRAAE